MTRMTRDRGTPVLWLDLDHDNDQATDGRSRYGAYVHGNADFDRIGHREPTPEFAVAAWRVATGPVMSSPALVRCHRRVQSVTVARNEFDGALCATAVLVAAQPLYLAALRPVGGGSFQDWPVGMLGAFEYPSGQDIAASPYLCTTVRADLSVPVDTLPVLDAVPTGQLRVYQAIVMVEELAKVLSGLLRPLIDALDDADR